MKKKISTPNAPNPVGPYSQAIRAGGFVFASGQIPLNPSTKELVRGPIEDQTRQVLENLKNVLTAAGSSLEKAVKTTVFLSDLNNFEAMNSVYATYFGETPPARSTVQAALPKGVDVEIDVIALE
ncbi:MAG: RidA family protein [Acidobacteriota bacterium]